MASVRQNFTTLATGLESYYVDNNRYICSWNKFGNRVHPAQRLRRLTSPIKYLSSFPYDEFEITRGTGRSWCYWYYCYWYEDRWSIQEWGASASKWENKLPGVYRYNSIKYVITSKGPDREDSFWRPTGGLKEYDPTNGTISWGDLHYWGPGNVDPGMVMHLR